jgi:magnesium transporter
VSKRVRTRTPPHKTAAAIMSRTPAVFAANQTAADTIDALRAQPAQAEGCVYATDRDGRLVGCVRLASLLRAAPDQALGALAEHTQAATADMDQEHVAALAADHGMSEVPVTDDGGRLTGVVTAPTLIRVVRQEHVEDVHRLAGIVHQTNYAAHALEISPWRRVRDRLPWLIVGLVGSAGAASVMAGFESTLAGNVVIAFFVPAIVYLADAIGTQTEAVAVRGLSVTHAPLGAILAREVLAGFLIGLSLALIAGPVIAVWFADARLALAVAASIVAAGTVATTIGLLLPWTLSRFGFDPAFGSGPVATVIQDVLSLVVYFALVVAIMPEA